jgi:hypothetical protein
MVCSSQYFYQYVLLINAGKSRDSMSPITSFSQLSDSLSACEFEVDENSVSFPTHDEECEKDRRIAEECHDLPMVWALDIKALQRSQSAVSSAQFVPDEFGHTKMGTHRRLLNEKRFLSYFQKEDSGSEEYQQRIARRLYVWNSHGATRVNSNPISLLGTNGMQE